jgi:hypothetical protein
MAASPLLPGLPRPAHLALLALVGGLLATAAGKPEKGEKFDKGDKLDKGERADFRDPRRDVVAEPANRKANRISPAELEQRNQDKLRERLEVSDDAEWAIISERIRRVDELRRTPWSATPTPRATAGAADKAKRTAVAPEQAALRSALADKLTDAEIRLRLARAHEVHEQHQAKLAQAQASLRAVLTVRQEAVAVTYGLLPP